MLPLFIGAVALFIVYVVACVSAKIDDNYGDGTTFGIFLGLCFMYMLGRIILMFV